MPDDASSSGPHDPRFHEGIRLFNEGRYFEAHEVLEEQWRVHRGPDRDFLKGLIQVSVAHLHASRGNAHGVRVLVASSRRLLEGYAADHWGLDLMRVLGELDRCGEPGLAPRFERLPTDPH